MIRRFNYTARKRIKKKDVSIEILDDSINPVSFNACFADLAPYALEPAARVFVEVYRGTSFMRFPFGTVESIVPPADRRLSEIEGSRFSRFRVKVVDDDTGRLLAATATLSPDKPRQNKAEPLLPSDQIDLVNQIWKLKFDDVEGVMLQLNERIEGIDTIANDPRFRSLVLPAVVREVLTYIIFVRKAEDADDDEESPWSKWLEFVSTFYPEKYPGPCTENEENREEECLGWIDGAVEAFCTKHEWKELYQTAARRGSPHG